MKQILWYVPRAEIELFEAAYYNSAKSYYWSDLAELKWTPAPGNKYEVRLKFNPAQPEFLILLGINFAARVVESNI